MRLNDSSASSFPQIMPIPSKRIKDLSNKTFGYLVALGYVGKNKWREAQWLCRCRCGNFTVVIANKLISGRTQSCGCFLKDWIAKKKTTHGMTDTSEYAIWRAMINRCENPNQAAFERYGGRGIEVCEQWRKSFECFIGDMGMRPGAEYSIDRIDNNLGYFPENCRWATHSQQNENTSRNRVLEFNGEKLTINQWAKKLGINAKTLYTRANRGISAEEILTTPVRKR